MITPAHALIAGALLAWTQPSAADQGAGAPAAADKNRFAIRALHDAEIKVDGRLDEPAWTRATVVPLTHEWYPRYNVAPPVGTECLVFFDERNLYVGFRAHDPQPAQIRARLADRDTPFSDDTVGFVVDTFHDRRRGYEFRVNPYGVQMDGTLDDGRIFEQETVWERQDFDGDQDWSWDAIWDAASRVGDDGFEVEIAVPLRQLRFADQAGEQVWGFLATRHYPRSLDHEIRSTPLDRNRNCNVCQFDTLTGFEDLTTGRNLEIAPTFTVGRTDARPSLQQPLEDGDEDQEVGASIRWGITPTVTLNATVNPDFSNVEADVAQLDVNERFTLFFPEKRPFFQERADYFTTPIDAVFTRTIADPTGGLKLTGKLGANELGLFAAEDRLNNLTLPGPELSRSTTIDQDVLSSVLRYRRDVGSDSALGFLYAGREADDYQNRVFGIDGSWRPSESNRVVFQYLRSSTAYPDQVVSQFGQPDGTFEGDAWEATFEHESHNWAAFVFLTSLDDDFRADSGFVPQVGIRQGLGIVQRIFWPEQEDSWFSRLVVQVDSVYTENQQGARLDSGSNLEVTWEGPLQSAVKIGLRPNSETYLGNAFENFRYDLFFAIRPSANVEIELLARQGEVIDFTNVRQTDFALLRPTVNVRLGRHLTGIFEGRWQTFEQSGHRYLNAKLAQTTLIYQFNVKTFVRGIVQYLDIERDPARYVVPVGRQTETLFTQFLFSYKLNPRTVLFAGYSDNSQGNESIDLTQRDRTFYLKIGYAWNL